MGKQANKSYYKNRFSLKEDPFPQPWGHRKHGFRQVNGETQKAQNMLIVEVQTRKRS